MPKKHSVLNAKLSKKKRKYSGDYISKSKADNQIESMFDLPMPLIHNFHVTPPLVRGQQ
ncbi:hypothetical protein I79_010116 [Cricetulus griseus]|uniref:Uncharacterized protein n=1 Tax=Cricetulus griseus TaxID=10029 RepID=G3HHL1_CRIGR|nr:hypothetical protein I79_010116 [Cricetulus griseus]